jgi:hypothetical protein
MSGNTQVAAVRWSASGLCKGHQPRLPLTSTVVIVGESAASSLSQKALVIIVLSYCYGVYCAWFVGEIIQHCWYRQYMQIWRYGQSLQLIVSLHLTQLYTSIAAILFSVQSAACVVHSYTIVCQSSLETCFVHDGSNRKEKPTWSPQNMDVYKIILRFW